MYKIPTILIFDSGIGGLSVYDEIKKQVPNANYIYVFDNEFFPYGDKSQEVISQRVYNIINAVTKQYLVDLIVIACNTASTICLDYLRQKINILIVGVVPAVKTAVKITNNNIVGLLATKATVQGDYTQNLIKQFAGKTTILKLGVSELALMAENKIFGHKVNLESLTKLMLPWINSELKPDTIILGCTHYPFLKNELEKIFLNTTFVDSGKAIAVRVNSLLKNKFPLNEEKPSLTKNIILSTSFNNEINKKIYLLKTYNYFQFEKYQHLQM